ncbi:hypothetical protein T484DRAFT_1854935 [Baffinella frigidus]|nr:hypothetical protein T484DRAFT_1854935 [Cryptophyta sp. CCMP2293]
MARSSRSDTDGGLADANFLDHGRPNANKRKAMGPNTALIANGLQQRSADMEETGRESAGKCKSARGDGPELLRWDAAGSVRKDQRILDYIEERSDQRLRLSVRDDTIKQLQEALLAHEDTIKEQYIQLAARDDTVKQLREALSAHEDTLQEQRFGVEQQYSAGL